MRETKDSGVPWIGEIPTGWKTRRIKTLFTERVELSETGTETLLSVSEYYGVDSRSAHIDEDEYLSRSESLVGYKKCYPGDIVSNIMLAWKGSLGVASQEGIVSPAYCVYKPSSGVYPKYYHYLFRTSLYTGQFKCHSKGIIDSRLRLYSPFFFDITALIPPTREQKSIANFLDEKCAEIDSILEKTRTSIEDYKALKLSVITEAVTKGIRGKRVMKDSGVEWIGMIPAEWGIIRKLSFLCNKSISYGIIKLFDPEENGVPVLRCSDVKAGYIDSSNIRTVSKSLSDEYKRTILKGGEIVINVRGTLGGCALVPEWMKGFNVAREVAVIDTSGIVSRYLMYYLLSNAFSTYEQIHLSGCVYVGLNIELLSSCPIPFPRLDEQQEIAAYLDEKCATIDSLIASKEALIAELEAYKKSIIYEFVTGKKEVPAV